MGVLAHRCAHLTTSFTENNVSQRVFNLRPRSRYYIVPWIKLYNIGASLQCAAWKKAKFYGVEKRVRFMNCFFYATKTQNHAQKKHKTTNQNPQKQLKNIRADLLAAKASAMSLDSHRPGHLLLPWALAIDQWSRCRECIVLWPSKWP